MKCKTCGCKLDTEGYSGLRRDCGGDCLLCVADVGDPEAVAAILKMVRDDRRESDEE